jgi:hypothetical protein
VGWRRAEASSELDASDAYKSVRAEAEAEILRTRAGGARGVRGRCGGGFVRRAFEISG